MIQSTILRFDSIDSTNLEAIRQARAGAPEGLCVVAREQTAGRGRLNRSWHSPRDAGLYFSVLLRPNLDVAKWPLIGLATALAVADTVLKSCGVQLDIKWPNDVCFGERKLCGILAETVETESGQAAIVGVGINLSDENFPAELKPRATSLLSACGVAVDRDLLIDELVKAFVERYEMLQTDGGGEHTVREWAASSSFAFGRRVRVTMEKESFTGITRGLESDGALRVETDDGRIRIVRAGDVTAVRAQTDESIHAE